VIFTGSEKRRKEDLSLFFSQLLLEVIGPFLDSLVPQGFSDSFALRNGLFLKGCLNFRINLRAKSLIDLTSGPPDLTEIHRRLQNQISTGRRKVTGDRHLGWFAEEGKEPGIREQLLHSQIRREVEIREISDHDIADLRQIPKILLAISHLKLNTPLSQMSSNTGQFFRELYLGVERRKSQRQQTT
jgi:hypothetical protein